MPKGFHPQLNRPLIFMLCFQVANLSATPVVDTDVNRFSSRGRDIPASNVFVYGDPTLDLLVPVKVIGAVEKAGIHFVPKSTDLLTLLSLAGGPSRDAEADNITIKRIEEGRVTILRADLDAMVSATDEDPIELRANDVVMVPQSQPIISDNVLRVIGFLGGIAGLLTVTVVLLKR